MKRPRVPLHDAILSARRLAEIKRQDKALEVLDLAVKHICGLAEWQRLREALAQNFDHSSQWAILYSKALTGTRDTQTQLQFTQAFLETTLNNQTAPVLLERAWALLELERYQEALDLLTQIMPLLAGEALGVAYKRKGVAMFALGLDWQAEFETAQIMLAGRLLGLTLMDCATCHQRSNNLDAARELLTQALPMLRGDHFHLAWARYNLGEIAARTMNPDAERHYTLAEQFTRRQDAKAFRSRALQGMGRWRRFNGDLLRAEDAYRQATRTEAEDNDKRAAHWSLGRTLRLMHRTNEALEILEVAKQIQTTAGIEIERAACWLALRRTDLTKSTLEQVDTSLSEPYNSIRLLLMAEFSRLEKNGTQALAFLGQVSFDSLNAREEIEFWTELQNFARLAGLELPMSQALTCNTVQVNACGVLEVRVNQIPIRLNPTGRVGELLALLLELNRSTHVETIIEYLYPEAPIANQKKPAVLNLVKRLRLVLGWSGSVIVHGKIVQLDPNTTWHYDATQVRTQHKKSAYLEGIRSNWALEIAQELDDLDLKIPRDRLLN
jgi:tetratricopeptide (TPR) repeat protein